MPGPLAACCSAIVRLGLLLVLLAGGTAEAWAVLSEDHVKRMRQVSAVFSEVVATRACSIGCGSGCEAAP